MDTDIRSLLEALAQWRKACKKLEGAVPDRVSAEQEVSRAQAQVTTLLREDRIAEAFDQLIQANSAPAEPSEMRQKAVRNYLTHKQEDLIAAEMRTVQPLQISRRELSQIIAAYLQAQPQELPLSSHDIPDLFPQLTEAIVQQYAASRSLPRQQKKRRKRKVATGVTFTMIGLGLMAGNSQSAATIATYSYILGGNALLQAVRDLIGEAD
jgi:hypothetical protein